MKAYLITPKNPESFWTFDRVLPSLGKRCVFPNLALPTSRGRTFSTRMSTCAWSSRRATSYRC